MKTIVVDNYQQMSKLGADMIIGAVKANPCLTLGLATGSTVLGVYARLREAHAKGQVSFANVRTVNLDEYVGLSGDNVQSYAYYMRNNLFDHVDIDLTNTFIPCGVVDDLESECDGYNKLLDIFPRELQLLGLGSDGHIAFNEPGSPFDSRTRVVQLHQSTLRDNSRLFAGGETPSRAISMGIADIVSAKQLLLLASGANKAQAVKDMIQGPVSEDCPASILQRHKNAVVILDKLAASLL